MTVLSKREWDIIRYLLEQEGVVSLGSLAQNFKISERTVRYGLENIEFLLDEYEIRLCRKAGVGVWIEDPEAAGEKIRRQLQSPDAIRGRALTQEERVQAILGLLFYEPDYLTSNDIADSLFISRSTVLKDLTLAEDWLEHQHIRLVKKPRLGLKAVAEEMPFRNGWLLFLNETLNSDAFQGTLYSSVAPEYSLPLQHFRRLLRGADLAAVKRFLFQVSDELDVIYADESIYELSAYLCIALKRIRSGHDVPAKNGTNDKILSSGEYRAVTQNISTLEEVHGVSFNQGERCQVAMHLTGAKVIDIGAGLGVSENETGFINTFLTEISSALGVDLTGDEVLKKNLLIHIKPAFNRLRYDITIVNPLREQIQRVYRSTFQAVKDFIQSIEGHTGFTINDDEIGYLTTHVACAVERSNSRMKEGKIRVLVACASGIGTSKLLVARLETEFDRLKIVEEVSIRQIGKYLENVDLIITTAPVEGIMLKPVILVSPLLDAGDVEKVGQAIRRLRGTVSNSEDTQVDKIVRTVHQFCKISDVDGLRAALETTLYDRKDTGKSEGQKMLLEMINIGRIQTEVSVRDRNDAIRKVGALLQKDGYCSEAYIDAMVKLAEELNAYMVIAPGLAMPHARPEDGAVKAGFAIIKLKEPIPFGHAKNDPVKIVIALSAVDNVGHLKAMRELSMLLADERAFEAFKACETSQEMLDIMTQQEKKFLEKQAERRK